MIKVYSADNLNREAVIDLWMASFGDTREYVEFFLDDCSRFDCVEYFIEDKLVSMLFLLEGKLAGVKCKYLYAACTHKDFRRRGLMEELIEYTKSYCKQKNYSSIFLVPANKKLYSYYAKFGFISSFNKKSLIVKSSDCITGLNITTDVNEILAAKKKLLKNIRGFQFDDETMKYTIKEHLFNNGKIFLKYIDDKIILIFYYYDDSNLIIKELLTDFSDISVIFKEHFGNKNSENIYICTPLVYNSRDIVEKYTKCGMCFPLDDITADFLNRHSDLYAGMYLD